LIRLLALDIDGTLLDSNGRLPEANRDAISRALDAGVEVVLATGRRFDFARPIFELLPGPLTLVLSNGAIVKTGEGQTLARNLLPREIARHVLERAPEHRAAAAVIFDRPLEGQVVFEAVDWEHPRHSRFFHANRPYISEVRPLEDSLTEDPVQVMFTGSSASMRRLFERLGHVAERPAARRRLERAADAPVATIIDTEEESQVFAVALTEYVDRDFSLVDVVRAGCSKGAALRQWTEGRGLTRDEVMAVGDNLNDLQMLEYAGRPVLMANALPELKARGWPVTASNDEAGVAVAIETFVFSEAS
jgi:hypothetical protein